MAWTDESRAKVISMYQEAEPTPENSMEIVQSIADELGDGTTANGVRMILSQAKVYVTKTPAKKAASTGGSASGDKAPRVSKEAAQAALTAAIEEAGGDADNEIISKLTGKAAQYFTAVIAKINGADDE